MRIFQDQISNYDRILKKYNEAFPEGKITFEKVVIEAMKELINNKDFDWDNIKNYNYYSKYNRWSFKFIKLPNDLYKQIAEKLDFKSLPKSKQGDRLDDVINTALFKATELKWTLRRQVLNCSKDEDDDETICWKKQIIDKEWNIERILLMLNKYNMVDNINVFSDKITCDCLACGHGEMAIYFNTQLVSCFSPSCKYHKSNIWTLLEDKEYNLDNVILELYDELIIHYNDNLNKIDSFEYEMRNSRTASASFVNSSIDKILPALTNNYEYLFRQGISKSTLIDCGVGYRDDMEFQNCSEANDFRHRICYVIYDKNGNAVGIQGRSIIDNDDERAEMVKNDLVFKKLYFDKPIYNEDDLRKKRSKMKKLNQKVMNTVGFLKSEHLYLINKYVGEKFLNVVIVEGPKDALKIYDQHLANTAVVSSFGCSLSNTQIQILKDVFGTEICIILAYDNDKPGAKGNIEASRYLKEAGFKFIRFATLPARNKLAYYNDWGEINATQGPYEKITESILVKRFTEKEYNYEMIKRGILSQNGGIRNRIPIISPRKL